MDRGRHARAYTAAAATLCMLMKKFVAGAAALALTACSPAFEQDRSVASEAGTEVPQRYTPQPRAGEELPDPPAPPPPPPALPGLMPLSKVQVRAELGSGASCTLSDGGPPLMVSIVGDAIVNDRGRVVHLKPEAKDWEALIEGDEFKAGDLSIEVDAGAVIARHEGEVVRDTSVNIVRGRRGFGVSHGPRWACTS